MSGAKEHPSSIARIVGGGKYPNGHLCVDSLNRVWKIINEHSGCSLVGSNHPAQIPYWTSYFISLPGLRPLERDLGLSMRSENPTILEELLRLSVKNGDLLKDERFSLLWSPRISEYGLSLEGYNDNHWLPMISLGVLSFGGFQLISSEAQRNNRKSEFVKFS